MFAEHFDAKLAKCYSLLSLDEADLLHEGTSSSGIGKETMVSVSHIIVFLTQQRCSFQSLFDSTNPFSIVDKWRSLLCMMKWTDVKRRDPHKIFLLF